MTTSTVFTVTNSTLTEIFFNRSFDAAPRESTSTNDGNVGRITGSVLGCAVFFGIIVSIGIIVARYCHRRRIMRNDDFSLKNATFPDDGVDNETYTTVEDMNDRQPVTSPPTFCAASKALTERTIENILRDGDPVYENISKETLPDAKEIIYEDIVKTESEACESAESAREKQQFFPEEAVSISGPPYVSMGQNFLDGTLSGATVDSRDDLYLHPTPDRHSLNTMAGRHHECCPNPK